MTKIPIFLDSSETTNYPPDLVKAISDMFQMYDNPFELVLLRDVAAVIVSCVDSEDDSQYILTVAIDKDVVNDEES